MKTPLYIDFLKISLLAQISHKNDLIFEIGIWSLYSFAPFFSLVLLLQRYAVIGDLTIHEIAVLYGSTICAYDIARMFGRGFDNFFSNVHDGTLDVFYLRPLPIVYQIFASEFFLRRLAGVTQGIAILCWGLAKLVLLGPYTILRCCISIVAAVFLYWAFFVLNASLTLVTSRENRIVGFFFDLTSQMGYYPVERLGKILRALLVHIFPISSCIYFPLRSMLRGEPQMERFAIAILVGLAFFILSLQIFECCRSFYTSVNN